MFEQELNFFISNQNSLLSQYRGKVLVIKGPAVIGVYTSHLEAFIQAQKTHELGTFMIQACEPGPDAYSITLSPSQALRV